MYSHWTFKNGNINISSTENEKIYKCSPVQCCIAPCRLVCTGLYTWLYRQGLLAELPVCTPPLLSPGTGSPKLFPKLLCSLLSPLGFDLHLQLLQSLHHSHHLNFKDVDNHRTNFLVTIFLLELFMILSWQICATLLYAFMSKKWIQEYEQAEEHGFRSCDFYFS